MPTPTTWPLMCAFSVTLLGVGLVTTLFVTLVGFLIGLIAATGMRTCEARRARSQTTVGESLGHPSDERVGR